MVRKPSEPREPEPELMTPEEVAHLLRRSIDTLRFWRYRREGPRWFRSGRRVFYVRADVLDWLTEQRRDGGC